jgi:hypothetical protein
MKVRDVGPNCLRVNFNVMDADELNGFLDCMGSMLPSELVSDLRRLGQQLQQEPRLRSVSEFMKKHPGFFMS